ncbi:GGDEF domain-containing protein [Rhodoferax sp. U11-2br]|uniref:GGDEF domain-containing protein n=1 Tax=Rhodoferax sp. U11-2br TaxID=2838878 RepID=UPI001BE85CDA|nr:GGDEF domain-containing protein [Rhodoferax sp. U11-2br]MBT3069221.1 bacteriohemerythrin [Rhodoferax sp. U11-2br]
MKAFRWDPCFLTGLPTVDEQHHYLIDIINQFGDALMRPQGASAGEIESLFQELRRYTVYHFQEEEALMESSGVYPGHITHHRQQHAQFLQDVMHMHAGMAGDNREAATALLAFLCNWLAFHILGTDRLMTWLKNAAQAGTPAEEALEAFKKTRDPATATLLQAMSQLVSQVSERSRALYELNQSLEARVAERTRELSELNQRLETLAMTDALTGLPNRRLAMQVLEREWQTASEHDVSLACMMIDADGFKTINDSYGHDAGDAVLRHLARTLQHSIHTDDLLCRLGGDEFLIICPNTPLAGALQTAEKLRRKVSAQRVAAGDGFWHGSISVGVAARQAEMGQAHDLLKAADQGVYAAKAKGRNCVASVQSVAVA